MKIYGNGHQPKIDAQGHFIEPIFDVPDQYTLFKIDSCVFDVRVNEHNETALFFPLGQLSFDGKDVIRLDKYK